MRVWALGSDVVRIEAFQDLHNEYCNLCQVEIECCIFILDFHELLHIHLAHIHLFSQGFGDLLSTRRDWMSEWWGP